MKNDEMVELLTAMENNFKQHAESQLEQFTFILEQHRASKNERLSQISQAPTGSKSKEGNKCVEVEQSPVVTQRHGGDSSSRNLNAFLKTLRVKVPIFDGSNVENWIYKINKYFDLHKVEPMNKVLLYYGHEGDEADGEATAEPTEEEIEEEHYLSSMAILRSGSSTPSPSVKKIPKSPKISKQALLMGKKTSVKWIEEKPSSHNSPKAKSSKSQSHKRNLVSDAVERRKAKKVKSSKVVGDDPKKFVVKFCLHFIKFYCVSHPDFQLNADNVFLNLPAFNPQPQLMHGLLLRELKHPNEYELWVMVSGIRLRFSMEDFALIFFLDCEGECNNLNFKQESNSFLDKYWPGCDKISKQSIHECFRAKRWGDDDEGAVKLAVLYFVQWFLLSSRKEKQVMREDLDVLDSGRYSENAWGKKSFDETIISLKGKLDSWYNAIQNSNEEKKVKPYYTLVTVFDIPSKKLMLRNLKPNDNEVAVFKLGGIAFNADVDEVREAKVDSMSNVSLVGGEIPATLPDGSTPFDSLNAKIDSLEKFDTIFVDAFDKVEENDSDDDDKGSDNDREKSNENEEEVNEEEEEDAGKDEGEDKGEEGNSSVDIKRKKNEISGEGDDVEENDSDDDDKGSDNDREKSNENEEEVNEEEEEDAGKDEGEDKGEEGNSSVDIKRKQNEISGEGDDVTTLVEENDSDDDDKGSDNDREDKGEEGNSSVDIKRKQNEISGEGDDEVDNEDTESDTEQKVADVVATVSDVVKPMKECELDAYNESLDSRDDVAVLSKEDIAENDVVVSKDVIDEKDIVSGKAASEKDFDAYFNGLSQLQIEETVLSGLEIPTSSSAVVESMVIGDQLGQEGLGVVPVQESNAVIYGSVVEVKDSNILEKRIMKPGVALKSPFQQDFVSSGSGSGSPEEGETF
ncbi:uncharacterized protein LOC133779156 [Humulus lupulus]|uniref:uncharacterized protein LOC133779156 n=1 Tax=Humulus lupulus TaxID=3486 RepID=UPI002B4184A3|nr:uncharacterized protein LOC133779156 [Humulus lupulus]